MAKARGSDFEKKIENRSAKFHPHANMMYVFDIKIHIVDEPPKIFTKIVSHYVNLQTGTQ